MTQESNENDQLLKKALERDVKDAKNISAKEMEGWLSE